MNQTLPRPKSELMQLWDAGIPIHEARFSLADAAEGRELAHILNTTLLKELEGIAHNYNKDGSEFFDMISMVTQNIGHTRDRYLEITKPLNKRFLELVRSGELWCLAFDAPRSQSSEPAEIMPEHWTEEPNWKEGELKANGLHLTNIRVIDFTNVKTAEIHQTAPKRGRPTFKPMIIAAFESLKADGLIDTTQPISHHYDLVRVWIGNRYQSSEIDAQNLTDEGIRKHFSPIFNVLKETNKQ